MLVKFVVCVFLFVQVFNVFAQFLVEPSHDHVAQNASSTHEYARLLQTVQRGACSASMNYPTGGAWTLTGRTFCSIYPPSRAVTFYSGTVSLQETYALQCSAGYYMSAGTTTSSCTMSSVTAQPSGSTNVATCTCGPATGRYSCPCIYDSSAGTYREAPLVPSSCSQTCATGYSVSGSTILDGVTRTHSFSVYCDPNAIVREVRINSISHTWIGDLVVTFRRGGVSFNCMNRVGGSTRVSSRTWIFNDAGSAMSSSSYQSGTFVCPSGAFSTRFAGQTGVFQVSIADLAGGDTGSYSTVAVYYESGSVQSGCPTGITSCNLLGRASSISYATASCIACSTLFVNTVKETATQVSTTQWNWNCNAGYYGLPTSQVCNTNGVISGTRITCTSCASSLPPNHAVGITQQLSSNVWRYTCPAGYLGAHVDYTCVTASSNGGYSTTRLSCTRCAAGNYCPGGTSGHLQYTCPGGTYNDGTTPVATSACQGQCAAGYYCQPGSTSATRAACGGIAVYCPAGSSLPSPVATNYYSTPLTAPEHLRTGQAPCPAFRTCINGELLPAIQLNFCPGGSIFTTVSESVSNTLFGPTLSVTTPGYTGTLAYTIQGYTNNDGTCGSQSSHFSIDTASSRMRVGTAINFPTCQRGMTYNLVVARSNDLSLSATCRVNVTVTQVIRTPVITDCSPRTVNERTAVGSIFGAPLGASTANVGTSLLWSVNPAQISAISIGMCDGQLRVAQYFRWATAPSYTFTVTVTNDGTSLGIGTATATCSMTVHVRQVPQPPAPSITTFRSLDLAAVGTFVGNVLAVDPDGYPIRSHVWSQLDTPHAFNIDTRGNISVRSVVDSLANLKSVYTYTLNVSNPYTFALYPITITIDPVPRPPSVTDTVRSIREDAVALTQLSPRVNATHPQGLAMTINITPNNTFACYPNGTVYLRSGVALNYNVQSQYIVTIVVQDSRGSTSTALLTINIIETNKVPYWVTTGWSFTIAEGSSAGTSLTGAPVVLAADPNTRDAITYSITGCTPNIVPLPFTISPTTGELTVSPFVGASLAYNASVIYTAGPQTIRCTVRAADNGQPSMSITGTFDAQITSIAPRMPADTQYVIAGNAPGWQFVGDLSQLAWTPYSPAGLTFSLLNADPTAEDDATFAVDGTGIIRVANVTYDDGTIGGPRWNYNTRRRFAVTVSVMDSSSGRTTISQVFVNITHVNRAPVWEVISPMSAPSRTPGNVGTRLSLFVNDLDFGIVAENHTFSLVAGNIQNTFAMRSWDGQLFVNNVSAANFVFVFGQPAPTYNLTARVCDAGIHGPVMCSFVNFTIVVTETNFPPVISPQTLSIAENSAIGTVVGTVSATDPDPGQSLQYILMSGNVDGIFAVNDTTGVITVLNDQNLNFEGPRRVYTLQVQVMDNGPGSLTAVAAITIQVTDVAEAPVVAGVTIFTIAENSAAGTAVGSIAATDVDAADAGKLVYSIAPATVFAIHAANGLISVNQAVLDFESVSSYSLTVTVRDTFGLTASGSVVVNLINQNDAPGLADMQATIPENARDATVVTVTAVDQDVGQMQQYALSRPQHSCWSTSVPTINSVEWFPVLLANTPVLQEVTFRAASAGVVRIVLRVKNAANNDRYELSFGESGNRASIRKCAAVCSAPLGSSVVIPPLSASRLSNWFVRIDRGNGQLTFGTRSSNAPSATYTTLLTASDATPLLVNELGATSSAAGRLTSVCFYNPSAAADDTIFIAANTGVVSTSSTKSFDFEVQRTYGVEVRTTDQPGPANLPPQFLEEYAVLRLSVSDVNEVCTFTKVACAGGLYAACLTVLENSPINTVVGNVPPALDPDVHANQVLSYSLDAANNTVGRASVFAIDTLNARVTVAQAVLDYEALTTFTITTTATDNGVPVLACSAQILIAVQDVNEAPVISAQVRSVPENSPVGTAVGTLIIASDPDNAASPWGQLTYTLVAATGADTTTFSIDAGTGQLRVASATLDFEAKSAYRVRVRATDGGGLSTEAWVDIAVLDVNEKPTIVPATRNISELAVAPAPAGLPLSAQDPDVGQSLSFYIVGGNGSALFRINRCSGQIELAPGVLLDFETVQVYVVEVMVEDDGTPQLSASANITLFVLDGNEAPTVVDQNRTVRENAAIGAPVGLPFVATDVDVFGGRTTWFTLRYSIVGGNERNIFSINDVTGQVSVARYARNLLDFEDVDASFFQLLIRVTDGGALWAQAVMAVYVTDVNEPPEFTEAAPLRSIDENCPRSLRATGDAVGLPIVATDEDAGHSALLTYSIVSGNSLGYFDIAHSGLAGGQLFVTAQGASALDFEALSQFRLSVQVTDFGRVVANTSETVVPLSAIVNVTIQLNNRNEAPIFPSTNRFVWENATMNQGVGAPLLASDPEDDVLTFTIVSGNSLGTFGVSASTGQLFVADPSKLDFETTPFYTLTISVRDAGFPEGAAAALTVAGVVNVTVGDVNEPPQLTSASFALPESPAPRTVVGSMLTRWSDPDSSDFATFSILQQDLTPHAEIPFAINATTGVIEVVQRPNGTAVDLDYEQKALYTLQVLTTDKGGLVATATVTISLTNVNEPPVWRPIPVFYARALELQTVGAALRTYIVDPDLLGQGNQETFTFVWDSPSGNTDTTFGLSASDGQLSVINNNTNSFRYPPGGPGPVYSLRVIVRDAGIDGAAFSVATTITVEVTDNNYPPTIPTYTFTVSENTAVGTLVGTVMGTDRNAGEGQVLTYSVSSSGANINRAFPFNVTTRRGIGNSNVGVGDLFVAWDRVPGSLPWSNLNYEGPVNGGFNTYEMIVTVTDSHPTRMTGSAVVIVNVLDVPESPYFNPSRVIGSCSFTFTIPENSQVGQQLTIDATRSCNAGSPDGGVLAFDEDMWQGHGNLSYTWKSGQPAALTSLFALNPTTGVVTVSSATLDFETQSNYTLVVEARDTTGRVDHASVTVFVKDVNEAPEVTGIVSAVNSPINTLALSENTPLGTFVGRVDAHDGDAGAWGRLTYTLVDNDDASYFSISVMGEVSLTAALDFEAQAYHDIIIVTTDGGGLNASLSIRVWVNDVFDTLVTAFVADVNSEAADTSANVASSPYAATHSTMQVLFQTAGHVPVIIHGTNFGPTAARIARDGLDLSAVSVTATYGPNGNEFNAYGCSVIAAGTTVQCMTVPGTGVNHVWRIFVNTTLPRGTSGTVVTTLRTGYLPPTVVDINVLDQQHLPQTEQTIPTNGDAFILVNGTNFGPRDSEITVTYGPTASEFTARFCVVVTDHLGVICKADQGSGSGFRFRLRVNAAPSQVSSSVSIGIRYASPEISSVEAPVLDTRGDDVVTITGHNFGPVTTASVVATYAANQEAVVQPIIYTASNCRVTVAHTVITCRSAAGIGRDHSWQVAVSGLASSPSSDTTNYKPPVITRLDGFGSNLASTEGGQEVFISGEQLGPLTAIGEDGLPVPQLQPFARYGPYDGIINASSLRYQASNCRVTVAHKQITCRTAPGTGKELHWALFLGGQGSGIFLNGTSNYHPPVIAYYSGKGSVDADTAGNELVVIEGRNFGPLNTPITATYGWDGDDFHAASCVVTVPHTQATCLTAVGAGRSHSWLMMVDGQRSVAPSTSYAAPFIASFEGGSDLSTEGGDMVTLVGQFFSIQQYLGKVTYGPTATEYTARNCYITSNHTRIRCITAPGTGRRLYWQVTIGEQMSRISEGFTSYAAPNITRITPSHGPTSGDVKVRLHGRNFGLSTAAGAVAIHMNAKGLPSPSMAELEAHWSMVSQGGAGMGSVATWINSLESPAVTIISQLATEQVLEFSLPTGFGQTRELFMSVDGVLSRIHNFTYDPPYIMNVSPDRTNVRAGFIRVFLQGSSFCDGTNNCGTVYVDGETVAAMNYTHNEIVFVVPLPPSPIPVFVEVDGVPSNTFLFSSPVPNFQALVGQGSWINMNTAGGEELYIAGVSDIGGVSDESIVIHIGERECTSVSRVQDGDNCAILGIPSDSPAASGCKTYRLTCSTPEGVGRSLPIVIQVPGGQSRADPSFTFSYAAPFVDDVIDVTSGAIYTLVGANGLQLFGVPTRGATVQVRGRNLGSASLGEQAAATVSFGDSFATVFNQSHTSLVAVLPAGAGLSVPLLLLVAGQSSADVGGSGTILMRYAAPTVASVAPQRASTSGGQLLIIQGSNFGPYGANATGSRKMSVTIGGRACSLDTTLTPPPNHDSLRCFMPAGQGTNLTVSVTVAGQMSSASSVQYAYAAPTVLHVYPQSGPTSGLDQLGRPINMTVVGTNLGLQATVAFVPEFVNAGEDIIYVQQSDVLSQNHTHITFKMPEGAGEHLQVVLEVGGQRSTDPVFFDYLPPTISSFGRDDKGPTDCKDLVQRIELRNGTIANRTISADCYPTRGNFPLSIHGNSFGAATGQVFVGARPCFVTRWSHTNIVCTAPQGYGDRLLVTVQVGHRVSANTSNALFSYDAPVIDTFLPNVPNAAGQAVIIRGRNFGFEATPVSILIGGLVCNDAEWLNDNTLACNTPADNVGAKNVSILVAGRSEPFVWYDVEQKIVYMCAKDWYGMAGEVCIDCDKEVPGAVCPGFELYADRVYSQAGYWRSNVTTPSDKCHPLRQHRAACPIFLACEPKESCLGANQCADGYTGDRCSQCLKGKYYRINGVCEKCPNSPWAIVIMFGLGGICACIIGLVLNRKNISLALIAIGIDYAQVLSMFARTRIRWPAAIKEIFNLLSAFNFNIDIAAPECAIPNVTFSMKWFFIEALPLFAFCVFMVVYTLQYCYKLCCRNVDRAGRHSHLPQLISTVIVMFRVLYLYLTRMTLDVFNCSPTDPPDGKTYMSGMLEIVCWESGSTQVFLLPFAFIALTLYTIGLPAAAFWFLYRRRASVMYDQILKAKGTGNDKWTNPRHFMFRRMWRNLYQHFIPEKWYWELVILARKAMIVFVSLMFRSSPSYQLSVSLLIMFACFSLHVRHTPYMTPTAAQEVVEEHRIKALTDPVHATIESEMRAVAKQNKLDKNRKITTIAHRVTNITDPLVTRVVFRAFDYNSVESVLLGCAILVNVAGIMFDSNRFNGATAGFYTSEYDTLAYGTILLIGFSLVYFFIAFLYDALAVCAPTQAACIVDSCAKAARCLGKRVERPMRKDAAKVISAKQGVEAQFSSELNTNPLMRANSRTVDVKDIANMATPPDADMWAHIRQAYSQMAADLARVSTELRASQKESARALLESHAGTALPPRAARVEFRPTQPSDLDLHGTVKNPLDKFRTFDSRAALPRRQSGRPVSLRSLSEQME